MRFSESPKTACCAVRPTSVFFRCQKASGWASAHRVRFCPRDTRTTSPDCQYQSEDRPVVSLPCRTKNRNKHTRRVDTLPLAESLCRPKRRAAGRQPTECDSPRATASTHHPTVSITDPNINPPSVAGAEPGIAINTLVLCQNSKLGLCVIPAQAGIQCPMLDSRLRGNDEPQDQRLTEHSEG